MVHVAIVPITEDVTAGSDVSIPQPYPDVSELVTAVHFKKTDTTHGACGATGAVYASATVLNSPITDANVLEVVDTTPASGQIQLKDSRTVVLGDDAKAGEFLLLVYIARGEVPGF